MATVKRKFGAAGETIPYKGLYIWEAERIIDVSTIIPKCRSNHITNIYITFNLLKGTIEQYRAFIREATRNYIKVHALFGDPKWALPSNVDKGINAIKSIIDFNNAATDYSEKFYGIQFDVEPHGLNGNNGYPNNWNDDRVGTIKGWLDNSITWRDYAKSNLIKMSYSILAFLDNTANYPVPTEYASYGQNVNNIVTDIFDEIILMAYRDTPEDAYNLAVSKIDYAKDKKIIVAFESTQQTPSNITYFDKGFQAMENAMLKLHQLMKDKPGYKGVAVHAWRQWELFTEPYLTKKAVRKITKIR
ncbi:hypothetical protein D3C87_971930 [compost metagenome]